MCRDCTQEPPICARYNYDTYNCVSVCTNTAPTNLVVTQTSATSSTLNWTPGTNGANQFVYVGIDKTNVENNCSLGGCAVSASLPSSQNSYNTGSVLAPGTIYYYRVVNFENATCSGASATVTALPSCTMSPTALSISPSDTIQLTAVINSSPEILRVDFASSNPTVATVALSTDTTYPYQTVVTGVTSGSATITATVYTTTGTIICQTGSASFPGSSNTAVTVISTTPWWQVKDGDVTASVMGSASVWV
jgi:hypothetical protein